MTACTVQHGMNHHMTLYDSPACLAVERYDGPVRIQVKGKQDSRL